MIHAGTGTESSNYPLKYPKLPVLPVFLLVMETLPLSFSRITAKDQISSPSLQLGVAMCRSLLLNFGKLQPERQTVIQQ